jgi:hypothetical protein
MADNLDPTLHNDIIRNDNPAMNFLATLNLSASSSASQSDGLGEDDGLPNIITQSLEPQIHSRTAFGRVVKSHMSLSNQSQAALDDYCVVSHSTNNDQVANTLSESIQRGTRDSYVCQASSTRGLWT